jgi:hypothetical protein
MDSEFSEAETVAGRRDPYSVQQAVDLLANWLIENHAPEEVRCAFCQILEAEADETQSRPIANYLRSVAMNCRAPMA